MWNLAPFLSNPGFAYIYWSSMSCEGWLQEMSMLAPEKCPCAVCSSFQFLLLLLPFVCAWASAHVLSLFKENEEQKTFTLGLFFFRKRNSMPYYVFDKSFSVAGLVSSCSDVSVRKLSAVACCQIPVQGRHCFLRAKPEAHHNTCVSTCWVSRPLLRVVKLSGTYLLALSRHNHA